MKTELHISESDRPRLGTKKGITHLPWRTALPFVLNPRGVLIHRVRSGCCIYYSGEFHHYAVHQWCGNNCTGESLELLNEPPANRLVCARCEAAAVAAGETTSSELVGRHVCIGTMKAHRLCCQNKQN